MPGSEPGHFETGQGSSVLSPAEEYRQSLYCLFQDENGILNSGKQYRYHAVTGTALDFFLNPDIQAFMNKLPETQVKWHML